MNANRGGRGGKAKSWRFRSRRNGGDCASGLGSHRPVDAFLKDLTSQMMGRLHGYCVTRASHESSTVNWAEDNRTSPPTPQQRKKRPRSVDPRRRRPAKRSRARPSSPRPPVRPSARPPARPSLQPPLCGQRPEAKSSRACASQSSRPATARATAPARARARARLPSAARAAASRGARARGRSGVEQPDSSRPQLQRHPGPPRRPPSATGPAPAGSAGARARLTCAPRSWQSCPSR